MNPLSPKQILRNLENGFFMTHQEQTETAEYIRNLQKDIITLGETVLLQSEELIAMRRELADIAKGLQ
jgi:hypothetical protein